MGENIKMILVVVWCTLCDKGTGGRYASSCIQMRASIIVRVVYHYIKQL